MDKVNYLFSIVEQKMKKMKTVILWGVVGLALGIAFMSCASTASAADSTYTETVLVPGTSAEDLFMKANLWFNDSFKGPDASKVRVAGFNVPEKSRVLTSDGNRGTILAKYVFLTNMKDWGGVFQIWLVYSTVQLRVSDGQYVLTFSDPINQAATYSNGGWIYSSTAPLFKDYVAATKNTWDDLSSALRETVGGTLANK
jgi:hypothetical protein